MAEIKTPSRTFDMGGFLNFVDEFKNESDRAAVILGAAKLDLLLYQIIQQYLSPVTGGKDELLDGDAPLGTFSAKIMLTNRLGLIDNEFTRALQFVRKIRNAFAHEISGCSLDNGSHRDRVKELVAQLKHKNAFITIRNTKFEGKDDPSGNFRTALAFLVGRLEFLSNHIECVDCSRALKILNKKALEMGEVENFRRPVKLTENVKTEEQSVQPLQKKPAKKKAVQTEAGKESSGMKSGIPKRSTK